MKLAAFGRTVSIAKELHSYIELKKDKQLERALKVSAERDLGVKVKGVVDSTLGETVPILVRAYTYLTGKHLPVALSETELRNSLLRYDGYALETEKYSYFYYLRPQCPSGSNVGVVQITGETDLIFAVYATEEWDDVQISLLLLEEDCENFRQKKDSEQSLIALLEEHEQQIAKIFSLPVGKHFTISFSGCPFSQLEEKDELLSF